jgi:hypothetical protein
MTHCRSLPAATGTGEWEPEAPHGGQAGSAAACVPVGAGGAVTSRPGLTGVPGAGRGYRLWGSCWSDQVLPSGSLKVTNEPHG